MYLNRKTYLRGFTIGICMLFLQIQFVTSQCLINIQYGFDEDEVEVLPLNADSCTVEFLYFVTNQGACDMDSVSIDIEIKEFNGGAAFQTDTLGFIGVGDTIWFTTMFGSDVLMDDDGQCIDTSEFDLALVLSSTPMPMPQTVFIDCPGGDGVLEVCANNTSIPCSTGESVGCVMAVDMVDFTGLLEDENIVLEWTTAQESNNEKYVIEHSTNGKEFKPIGEVKGAGDSYEFRSYGFVHDAPMVGTNYYQIIAHDYNGQVDHSGVIQVNYQLRSGFQVFPNPTRDDLSIHSHVNKYEDRFIDICDLTGKVLFTEVIKRNQQLTQISLAELSPGMYLVQMQDGEQMVTKRIIKN